MTTNEPKSFARRDMLLSIEAAMQEYWEENKSFEVNAPADDEEKKETFFVTFPYPYMNGRLHLGHAFTVTKADFAANFHRLLGKHVLFPFSFHCTGMPIVACSEKLKRELAGEGKSESDEEAAPVASRGQDFSRFRSKRGKIAPKKTTQASILRSMDVDEDEIPKFIDPLYWVDYFPPRGKIDLKKFGVHVDWRRSFVTTDINPYYDSFIQWQFDVLKRQSLVDFGTRLSVYSPLDGQPCADHDRATGEGVLPQELTIIEMEVVEHPKNEKWVPIRDKRVVFAAATLRPETMYGQTNCWIGPKVTYGAYRTARNPEGEVFVCTDRAYRNMIYQDILVKGEPLTQFIGSELIGVELRAPLSFYDTVFVLPMPTVTEKKGTAVVTSVPSDSTDDYILFHLLKTDAKKRQHYGVKDEWIEPYDIIPIIEVGEPLNTKVAAQTVCEEMKIKSEYDIEKLTKAHDIVYKEGFYSGRMLVGKCKGMRVSAAKDMIKDYLIKEGKASVFSEPASEVISRSGDECVVAKTDQWYIRYGEEKWREDVKSRVSDQNKFDTYGNSVRKAFMETLDWLTEWACSRSLGLGSHLFGDKNYVIESLSDSTIYMAYYTVSHLLQSDMKGSEPGELNISADKMTKDVWEYIFSKESKFDEKLHGAVGKEKLDRIRREFWYWYPLNLRVSGKDLIQNHLTMFLYNHAACFVPDMMPRGVFCNGHVMVDAEKMSKSKGNFLTLEQSIQQYGADATRVALANGGDGLDDANFESSSANAAILRLTKELQWIEDVLALEKDGTLVGKPESELLLVDRIFRARIRNSIEEAHKSYDRMVYRDALKAGVFDIHSARDEYRSYVGGDDKMDVNLVRYYIDVSMTLLYPIAPHFAEHVWRNLLGYDEKMKFPSVDVSDAEGAEDRVLLMKADYGAQTLHNIRTAMQKKLKKKQKRAVGGPTKSSQFSGIYVYVRKEYSPEQLTALRVLRENWGAAHKEVMQKARAAGINLKKMGPFIAQKREEAVQCGMRCLNDEVAFDEKDFLVENMTLFVTMLNLPLEVFLADDESCPDPGKRRAFSLPLSPTFHPY